MLLQSQTASSDPVMRTSRLSIDGSSLPLLELIGSGQSLPPPVFSLLFQRRMLRPRQGLFSLCLLHAATL
jgi:hypothetical protein